MLPFILFLFCTQLWMYPLGSETKSKPFCFAFRVLKNHLTPVFLVRSVSFLSHKNTSIPVSVPSYEQVEYIWPKTTHSSAYFFSLFPYLFSPVAPCSPRIQVLAVAWKHFSLGLCTCFPFPPLVSSNWSSTSSVNSFFTSRQSNHISLWVIASYTFFYYSSYYTILQHFDYIYLIALLDFELPSRNSFRHGFKTRSLTSNNTQLFYIPGESL